MPRLIQKGKHNSNKWQEQNLKNLLLEFACCIFQALCLLKAVQQDPKIRLPPTKYLHDFVQDREKQRNKTKA
jgi:hypothetical protein